MNRSASIRSWSPRALVAAALALLVLLQASLPLAHVVSHELAHLLAHADHDDHADGPAVAGTPTHLDEGHCCVTVIGVTVDAQPLESPALPIAALVAASLEPPAAPDVVRPLGDGHPRAPPLA